LSPSAISRRPRPRHSITRLRTACYRRHDSNETASGEPGAVRSEMSPSRSPNSCGIAGSGRVLKSTASAHFVILPRSSAKAGRGNTSRGTQGGAGQFLGLPKHKFAIAGRISAENFSARFISAVF
jgi:hypothetical protein